jgi:hypothetical protein
MYRKYPTIKKLFFAFLIGAVFFGIFNTKVIAGTVTSVDDSTLCNTIVNYSAN